MSTYIQTFEVTGKSRFPVDMLRYDRCTPNDSNDAVKIETAINREEWSDEERTNGFRIRLSRTVQSKSVLPTAGRWASFGWRVDETKTETRKV